MSQSSAWRRWAPIVLGTVCILCAIAWHQSQSRAVGQRYATLTLLIPDRMALDAPEVRIWTQADGAPNGCDYRARPWGSCRQVRRCVWLRLARPCWSQKA